MTQALALFSGGLDSILAARLLLEQGIKVRCLHFVSPFFGHPALLPLWSTRYGLDIELVDVGQDMVRLLTGGPRHGLGKVLNPCVDCKILMLRRARTLLEERGADFLVSGEVLGQRPMSQRRDTLNIIRREAGVSDRLLRPLSARLLPPTAVEQNGLVDRSRLMDIAGRGRGKQMELARRLGLSEVPNAAGGCRLTERENARRYWPLLAQKGALSAADFHLANIGRQFWQGPWWLSLGRNESDNAALADLAGWRDEEEFFAAEPRFPGAFLLRLAEHPGPLAILRAHPSLKISDSWPPTAILREAAALLASYAPRAAQSGELTVVRAATPGGEARVLRVQPCREVAARWELPSFQAVRDSLRGEDHA